MSGRDCAKCGGRGLIVTLNLRPGGMGGSGSIRKCGACRGTGVKR